jgi:iron complex transport system ATP-binding protein
MNKRCCLSIENLHFSFKRNEEPFFAGLSFSCKPNSLNFIQGKNGVGKSTLLRALQGNIRSGESIQGTLHIDEIAYDLNNPQLFSNRIAFVPQKFDDTLVDTYSFSENLRFVLMNRFPGLHALPPAKSMPPFIEKYGISYNAPVSSLSGGQRQILSILMAMQQSPDMLFLDEPTAALDEENANIIMAFLTELSTQGVTIILIVHNKELIQQYGGDYYFALEKNTEGKRIMKTVRI